MSNVTLQEALIAAIELIQCFEAKLTNSQTAHGLPSEKVKRKLRDVISEIEKCEPVAEVMFDYASNGEPLHQNDIISQYLSVGTKLYTSPQPRDWVRLSDSDIENLADRYLERVQPYSEYVASVNDLKQFAEAYYAEQLNTKG